MSIFNWLKMKATRPATKPSRASRARLEVETLETRLVPYTASTNAWPQPELITIGFVTDGTIVGSNAKGNIYSNLQSTFNAKFGSAAAWENQILKAAQQWAQQTNVNFTVITDNGAPIGSGNYQQGDPNMADIRISGYNFNSTTLAQTYMPPPVNNTSFAGDMQFNTGQTWNIGSTYDLFTVATHEFGHALGLYHSTVITANMYGTYTGVKTGLATDDIQGIQSIYGGARNADAYGGTNTTFATAANVTSTINTTTKLALITNLTLNSSSSPEWFKFTEPAGANAQLKVTVTSSGLSLLDPEVLIYNSSDQLLGSANGGTYGATVKATGTGGAGQVLYVEVTSTDAIAAFKTGAYALALDMTAGTTQTVPLANTKVLNGSPVSAGGGQPLVYNPAIQISGNSSSQTNPVTSKTTAMDANGNFVVVWSTNVPGSGYSIFGQRYNNLGVAQGSAFQVNTFTGGNQTDPTVAMNATGSFVVTWSSFGQIGSGSNIYARSYNALGVALSAPVHVNTTVGPQEDNSSIAMDAGGNYVVTWSGNQSGNWEIYGQRFSAQGVAQGGQFQVNTNMTGGHDYSSVAMDAASSFVVTWTSLGGQDGSGWGVYAQQYNAQGVVQGGEFQVNTYTAGSQGYSTVAMNPNSGDFVITWSSNGEDGSGWGVYAQCFNAQGVKQGPEFRANTYTTSDQTGASVAVDGNDNILITWQSNNENGKGWAIYAQQYVWSGTAIGTEFRVNSTIVGNQQYASVATDGKGDAVVVWTNTSGSTPGVYGQLFGLDGGTGLVPGIANDQLVAPEPGSSAGSGPSVTQPAGIILVSSGLAGDAAYDALVASNSGEAIPVSTSTSLPAGVDSQTVANRLRWTPLTPSVFDAYFAGSDWSESPDPLPTGLGTANPKRARR
jgi:hypothetical protein